MAHLFLSHSSRDKTFVQKLAEDLESAGHRVWLDEVEIRVGQSIIQKIEEGIDKTEAVVLVLSKNSVASEWVTREWHAKFFEEVSRRKVLVLPIVKDDCAIPPLLRAKKHARFFKNYALGFAELLHAISVARDEAGIFRAHPDFIDIKDDEWIELCRHSRRVDLLIMYGDTWRNHYLKHLQEAVDKQGGRLRVVLPNVESASPLSGLIARRLNKSAREIRERVNNAIDDFAKLFPRRKTEVYTTTAYLNHAVYLFDSGGILALYAYEGRVPTPAIHVGEGYLLKFLRRDFEWLVKPKSGFCTRIR